MAWRGARLARTASTRPKSYTEPHRQCEHEEDRRKNRPQSKHRPPRRVAPHVGEAPRRDEPQENTNIDGYFGPRHEGAARVRRGHFCNVDRVHRQPHADAEARDYPEEQQHRVVHGTSHPEHAYDEHGARHREGPSSTEPIDHIMRDGRPSDRTRVEDADQYLHFDITQRPVVLHS